MVPWCSHAGLDDLARELTARNEMPLMVMELKKRRASPRAAMDDTFNNRKGDNIPRLYRSTRSSSLEQQRILSALSLTADG